MPHKDRKRVSSSTKASDEQLHDEEVARRRDEAIKRALRTPPTHLKDIPRKRPPKQGAPPSSKRGGS
jgi:hypothetical protein